MNREDLEKAIRLSEMYSTLLSVPTGQIKLTDLYKSDNFVKWLKSPDFGLYIWSNSPGSGKTVTALKLIKHLMKEGYTVLAVSFIDYKNLLKKTFGANDRGEKTFYDHVYKYDFILLDDISYGIVGDWTLEILKDLFDHSFNNGKPRLILTSQVDVTGLPMPEALRSRIYGMCKVIQFPEMDRRKLKQNDFNF